MDALTQQIVKAQTGDRTAYTHIVRQFQDMAVGYAYALVKDVHLAQDVAQEAFIDAYLHLSQLREPNAFAGWFRTVVFKHANRIHRKHQSPVVDVDKLPELADPTQTPDKMLEQRETQDQVQAALHSLPDLEAQIATLFYISDYSRQQIADFLQMPIKSVIYRLKSARRMLKERIIKMSKQSLQKTAPSRNNDFTNDIMSRLQAIEHLHESFTESLATTFSEALGKPVTTQIAFRDLTIYEHVHKTMSIMPSLTYTVTMEPLGGDAIFSMYAPVVHGLLTGGTIDQRTFTKEEAHQMTPIAKKVIDHLTTTWQTHSITLTNPMVETDFDYVRLAKPKDAIIIVGISIHAKGLPNETLNPKDPQGQTRPAACLCYPLSTLESILPSFEPT